VGFDCAWSTASAARCVADVAALDWAQLVAQAAWFIPGALLGSLVAITAVLLIFARMRG